MNAFNVFPMAHFDISSTHCSLADLTVQYLHRTVNDFLGGPQVWRQLRAAGLQFNPHLALYNSFVLQLKCMAPDALSRDTFWRAINECMQYAYLAQEASKET